MDNPLFNEKQTKDWAKFWQGELGELYLQRLDNTKQLILAEIMNNADKEMLSNLAGRAAGIELIIQDIRAGILAGNNKAKEAKAKVK